VNHSARANRGDTLLLRPQQLTLDLHHVCLESLGILQRHGQPEGTSVDISKQAEEAPPDGSDNRKRAEETGERAEETGEWAEETGKWAEEVR
jgi:hypothetical protein